MNSWGRYPKIKSSVFKLQDRESLKSYLSENFQTIPYGNGRSYGDSALNSDIVDTRAYNHFLSFDSESGLLHTQAGALLSDILETFLPRGWFLKVTPGTKLITIGGAIASDVHGKNHHIEGCFSSCVKEFNLMLPNGEIKSCSESENRELFLATSGGVGLTGVILDAKIYLKRVESKYIEQKTIKNRDLEQTFKSFEEHSKEPYSVAWIDCLAKGDSLGKSILMVGDFLSDKNLSYTPKKKLSIGFEFPTFALNSLSVKAFNWLYYLKAKEGVSKVDIDTFFYPLDSLDNWNRIYGKSGFTQYQFILPKDVSFDGLREILETISKSKKGSFLAVLKLYGRENENYLSFPIEGYSLALDFKIEKSLFPLLDRLDEIVLKYGGRVYLAKDVRVSKEVFESGYPKIEKFRELRRAYKMDRKFQSLQSERVGI